MTDANRAQFAVEFLEMVTSFNESIIEAGGVPWSAEQMKNVTVFEMFCRLSTNGIRFTYQRRKTEVSNMSFESVLCKIVDF